MKILIIGNRGGTNVGGCLELCSKKLGFDVNVAEAKQAMEANPWVRKFSWRILGRRPPKLAAFSESLFEYCKKWLPDVLIATGISPVNAAALKKVDGLGILKINYLTDDPWNPAHRSRWFFEALPQYDLVWSTRRSNLYDLKSLGCREVRYLPFAYDPDLHYPETPSPTEKLQFSHDVVFVGAGDKDRIPYISALIAEGVQVGLYGSFWEKYKETKGHTRGQADVSTLRKATSQAKVALCLVRRANRDGHVMRSFEIPAIGTCMLVEDTVEHREIFGAEMEAVAYFDGVKEMIMKARWLLENDSERGRMASVAHRLVMGNGNSYLDRLKVMLGSSAANLPV